MKKILLVFSAVAILTSCNKSDKYVVTGTIEGIENGKNVILEVQDEMGQLKPVDTVKIENGKFTFEGNATEPAMHLIQIDQLQGKVAFILENGDIDMKINKDSLNITKISGTYNNDELTQFKEDGMKIQKKMMKFQTDNMAAMNAAQQSNDTVVMNKLRKEYGQFQEDFLKQSEGYVKNHPKAFISALIIEGMFNQMSPDIAKIKGYYAGLDKSVQDTKVGKSIKTKIDQIENPAAAAGVPPMQTPPTASPADGDSN